MKKVEIIAEIAQAHDGSIGILHSYIDALAKRGIDTIKFQMHIAEAESSDKEPFRTNFSYEDNTRYDYWHRMGFSLEQWKGIKQHCQEAGVGFLCSPFSIKACEWLKELGETRVKIASGEIDNKLMHDYIATFAKEVLISSGMSTIKDLKLCEEHYLSKGISTSVFQCTTAYPTPAEQVGLNAIEQMRNNFDCPIGLSDHSGEIYPSLAAIALGATKLEFHAVFDKDMFGPDAISSLSLNQIETLVEGVRFIQKAHANPIDKTNAVRYDKLKAMFGKSLAVRKDLPIGHVISVSDLESKKPAGEGHPASNYEDLLGKKIIKPLKKYNFINLSDCE